MPLRSRIRTARWWSLCRRLPSGMEAQAAGKFLPADRISPSIYHVGFLVGNTPKSLAFYEDVLGFKETWRGGRDPKVLSWINLRVPDGTDYIELMLYSKLPATYGTQNHTSLVVPDIQKAVAGAGGSPGYKNYLAYAKQPLEIRTWSEWQAPGEPVRSGWNAGGTDGTVHSGWKAGSAVDSPATAPAHD